VPERQNELQCERGERQPACEPFAVTRSVHWTKPKASVTPTFRNAAEL
jgi:hypothetical protein